MTSESQPGNSAEALQAEPENVHEIVIGLTRAIGIDTQPICTSLTKKLGNTYGYDVADIVKVSKLFQLVNSDLNLVDESEGQFSYLVSRMNFGDALRQRFKAAPGLLAAADISRKRRLLPRGAKKAFIIDSLMHPDEIRALRELYGQSFYLIALTDDAMKRK